MWLNDFTFTFHLAFGNMLKLFKKKWRPRGMRREEGSGWGTHIYLWRIHFDIWQNQYNIVKFKNKIKLKKKRNECNQVFSWHLKCSVLWLVAQLCPTLCDPMDCSPPGSSVDGDSPGKNTGVDSLSLLQRIFLTQELNCGLLPCRWILYQVSYQGSPLKCPILTHIFLPKSSQYWLIGIHLSAL